MAAIRAALPSLRHVVHVPYGPNAVPDTVEWADLLAETIEEGLASTAVPAKARKLLREDYSWQSIARRTVEVYGKAKKEKRLVSHSSLGHWDHEERTGNLLRPDAV